MISVLKFLEPAYLFREEIKLRNVENTFKTGSYFQHTLYTVHRCLSDNYDRICTTGNEASQQRTSHAKRSSFLWKKEVYLC